MLVLVLLSADELESFVVYNRKSEMYLIQKLYTRIFDQTSGGEGHIPKLKILRKGKSHPFLCV